MDNGSSVTRHHDVSHSPEKGNGAVRESVHARVAAATDHVVYLTRRECCDLLDVSQLAFKWMQIWMEDFPHHEKFESERLYSEKAILAFRNAHPEFNAIRGNARVEAIRRCTIVELAEKFRVPVAQIARWGHLPEEEHPLRGGVIRKRTYSVVAFTEEQVNHFEEFNGERIKKAAENFEQWKMRRVEVAAKDSPEPTIDESSSEERKRRAIVVAARKGQPIKELAQIHECSQAEIRRIIDSEFVEALDLSFVPNNAFATIKPGSRKEQKILAPMPCAKELREHTRAPTNLPAYLKSLYEIPLLTREQEGHLFRKMNFLKFCASSLRDDFRANPKLHKLVKDIRQLHAQAVTEKNTIIHHNLRLVVSIVKRHMGARDDFFTLVSDGNLSLMKAAEKFDFERGTKFSTYATWAIVNNFRRALPRAISESHRQRTGQEAIFKIMSDTKAEMNADMASKRDVQERQQKDVQKLLDALDPRLREVVERRFGLNGYEQQTLEQIGKIMNLSKERVRQIVNSARRKMQVAAQVLDIKDRDAMLNDEEG